MAKIIYAVSGGSVGYTETKDGARALGILDLVKVNSDFFDGSEGVVESDYFDEGSGGERVEAVVKTGAGYRIQKRRIKAIEVLSDEDVGALVDENEDEDEDYDDEDEDKDYNDGDEDEDYDDDDEDEDE